MNSQRLLYTIKLLRNDIPKNESIAAPVRLQHQPEIPIRPANPVKEARSALTVIFFFAI